MDPIKEAFSRIKEDISSLTQHVQYLHKEQFSIQDTINLLYELQQTNQQTLQQILQHIEKLVSHQKEQFNAQKALFEAQIQQITELQQTQTRQNPTQLTEPTHNFTPYALKSQYLPISTGNEGVPTNQPTNQQTNQHSGNEGVKTVKNTQKPTYNTQENTNYIVFNEKSQKTDKISQLQRASEILNSLDDLKKEVRFKFKQLTDQEMNIYASIYQLNMQDIEVDYQVLASKLSLSEISIRDYVHKLIKKGIPVDKTKSINKKVLLKIPQDFQKVASLETIMQLREL